MKDHNDETGRGRKTCKFYKELDTILGHRPASVPTVLVDTGFNLEESGADSGGMNADEGEDIQAESPLDAALIPPASSPSTSSTQDKEPEPESGAGAN